MGTLRVFWRRRLVIIYLRWENKTISLQIRQQPFMDYGAWVGADNQGGLATKGRNLAAQYLTDAPSYRVRMSVITSYRGFAPSACKALA